MSRHQPMEILTHEICNYGCGLIAKYKFKSGKLCCSDAIQRCNGHILQGIKTKKKDIDKDGLNALQRGQKSAHIAKLNNGGYKKAGQSISATKNKLDNAGKRNCDISNEKMRQTKLIVGIDGLTNAQRSARKMANTRLADIDENGLNQYERWTNQRIQDGTFDKGFRTALLIKVDLATGINVQGTYEQKFIDRLVDNYGADWVKKNVARGPSLQYIDYYEKTRWYMSDFIIENTIYEIKSNWTWNKRGTDLILEQNNINKLKSAVVLGYDVKLIREGIEIVFT